MSYILDALRKSDEERRRGTTPTLLTPQVAAPEPARSRTLAYGVVAGVILVAGIAIGALGPWQSEPPIAGQEPVAVKPADAPKTQVAAVAAQPPASTARPQAPATAVPQPPGTVKRTEPAPRPVASRPPEPAKPTREPVPAARKPASKADAKPVAHRPAPEPAKPQTPVVAFGELPLAVQQEMPKLQISAHAYSAVAGDRLVSINERIAREGDSVASGLVLEEITPSGMILSYRGYRFRRSAR